MIWLAGILVALSGLSLFGSRQALAGANNAASALGAAGTVLKGLAGALAVAAVVLLAVAFQRPTIWTALLTGAISACLWVTIRRRADARTALHGVSWQAGGDMLLTAAAIILSAATVALVVVGLSR